MDYSYTYNGIKIPSLILGTYKLNSFSNLREIVRICLKYGISGFDTAPSYKTEGKLGKIIHDSLIELGKHRDDLFIGTKIDAWQMQDTHGRVYSSVDKALKQMNLDYFNQLLIHWPIPEYFEATWDSLTNIYKEGKVKSIGVCNVRERHLLKLLNKEVPPMIVQNERHPLRTDEGTMKFCKKNNIVYQAYSPVGQMIIQIQNSSIVNDLARKYNKSISQIIMRWHIETGSIPVFMTTKHQRILEYSEIFNFSMEKGDLHSISSLNEDFKIFVESVGCPGF